MAMVAGACRSYTRLAQELPWYFSCCPAVVLFTAFFVIFAALIAVFLLLLVAIDHIFQRSIVAIACIGRSVQSSTSAPRRAMRN